MPATIPANRPPERPRLVLRLGFAGHRVLAPAEAVVLCNALDQVFVGVRRQLTALSPQAANDVLTRFYADQPPLLRLVTGLCEGADQLAAEALDRAIPRDAANSPVATEFAAVLPFDPASTRASRPASFRAVFDRQAARCAYIVSADGSFAGAEGADERHHKAYRAQSALLLRQADLLLAAGNPQDAQQVSGTLATVNAALSFRLPVLFIDTATGGIRLIAPEDELASVLSDPAPEANELETALTELIRRLLIGPIATPDELAPPTFDDGDDGLGLLAEYFDDATQPPLIIGPGGKPKRRISLRERAWALMLERLSDGPKPGRDPILPAYADYRARATALNYHYSGQNRGAFLLNYLLAVLVVMLGALGMTLGAAVPDVPAISALLIGGLELVGVLVIAHNTHAANAHHWNDRAVDYRYLAERLRSLFYLPWVGSFRPPQPSHPPAHSIPQSPVDWLAEAIARSVSPADLPDLIEHIRLPANNGGPDLHLRVLRLRPRRALRRVQRNWLHQQVRYHRRNARAMARLEQIAQRLALRMGPIVVALLAITLGVGALNLTDTLSSRSGPWLLAASPWLALLATVLPAAVVALSGLRFQAEARTLAERSTLLCRILGGPHADQADTKPEQGRCGEITRLRRRIIKARRRLQDGGAVQTTHHPDIAAWCLDSLHLTERIAEDCIREVSEWSVLYRKQVPEI